MDTPRPDGAVISENVPFRLLRYSAWRDVLDAGRPGQFRELISSASCHPSPSASKNAAPEPIVSGKYFRPNAPLLCRKRMPAAEVTSVNVGNDATAAGATCRAAASDMKHSAYAAAIHATCRITGPPVRGRRARVSTGARCCRADAVAGMDL